jgi:hypothetical protein
MAHLGIRVSLSKQPCAERRGDVFYHSAPQIIESQAVELAFERCLLDAYLHLFDGGSK